MDDHSQAKRPNNLKIVGESISNGGLFQQVKVTGEAEINGDIDCLSFKCTGNAVVNGDMRSNTLKAMGDLKIKGSLDIAKARLTGDMEVQGGIRGEEVNLYGNCTASSGIQAERFHVKGGIQLTGMLNAERIKIRLIGPSNADEIVGSHIEIGAHRSQKWKLWTKLNGIPALTAGVIEGDIIRLENTTAEIVRGREVIIGSGCRIGLVEYSRTFQQDPTSEVTDVNRTEG